MERKRKATTIIELVSTLLKMIDEEPSFALEEWHGWDDGSLIIKGGYIESGHYDED